MPCRWQGTHHHFDHSPRGLVFLPTMDKSLLFKKPRHPILEDFLLRNPGCDEDEGQRTFSIYQDLTEVKAWWYTELAFSELFEKSYIVGQPSKSEPKQAIVPIGVEEQISINEMHQYFSNILIDDEPVGSLILAVNDFDTTTVYYKITKGLSPPDSPETANKLKTLKSQKLSRKRQFIADCVRHAEERLSKQST
ncbi:tRNA-splicing endonuclease subunit Sen15-like isoform X1 [Biomphalaria glabrata]|uniref:tRNA-splicing endonuclease subunit Sen15-like isoform X1 n=2 Tax=Biomphalaria glabrata TaxID=6526 RepID=A0A9U8ECU5_BIOGL|nr:tRNA-splicing endonuclease subunit Sen15-like isoform X1 [Biomphalaria glabrata]